MTPEDIHNSIKKFYNRLKIKDLIPKSERFEFRLRTNFNTASWMIEQTKPIVTNIITVGEQALDMLTNEFSNKERLLHNLLFHEVGHSLYTSRDMKGMIESLTKLNVPFSLLNIFEDTRMEKLVEANLKHRFNWMNYQNMTTSGFGTPYPESLLIAYQSNGEVSFLANNMFIEAYVEKHSENEDDVDEVKVTAEGIVKRVSEFYYLKIIEAETTEDLFYLLRMWRDEFTSNEDKALEELQEKLNEIAEKILEELIANGMPNGNSGKFDLQDDEKPEETEEKPDEVDDDFGDEVDEFDDSSDDTGELHDKPNENGPTRKIKIMSDARESSQEEVEENKDSSEVVIQSFQIEIKVKEKYDCNNNEDGNSAAKFMGMSEGEKTETDEEHTSLELLRHPVKPYDRKLASKVLPKYKKILNDKSIVTASNRPSKRLHNRNITNDRDKVYKRKQEIAKKKKNIALVMDLSGSMNENGVIFDMNVIVGITNQLAISNKITGNLILSTSKGYQTIKLPMLDTDIDRIVPHRTSEGLNNTITKTMDLLVKSDYVFVLTDGDICDEPINKKMLRQRGINPIGLYLGETKHLSKWFDRYISRKSIDQLIDQLVRIIK